MFAYLRQHRLYQRYNFIIRKNNICYFVLLLSTLSFEDDVDLMIELTNSWNPTLNFCSACLVIGMSLHGAVVNVLNNIVVSKFELQSRYCIHLRTNTPGKRMNSLIFSAMGWIVPVMLLYKNGFGIDNWQKETKQRNRNLVIFTSMILWLIKSFSSSLIKLRVKIWAFRYWSTKVRKLVKIYHYIAE